MNNNKNIAEVRGLLGRLRRDVRGNALALMAAMLIPLTILSGSAVDLARMYAVKTRLQQACDTGALAGRKVMNDTGPSLSSDASATARNFFDNNFRSGWFKTTAVDFTATKTTEGQVSATATATVPMTIMTMFGMAARTINVACEARYDVADADIMFVLDTTGSMACLTSDSQSTCDGYASNPSNVVLNADGSYSVTEKSGSRISGLRSAVLSFYNTLTSPANKDPTTHFRFGFVPYSATVNVGSLLPRNYLATSQWTYQTRYQLADVLGAGTTTTPNKTQTQCIALNGKTPYTANPSAIGQNAAGYTATQTTAVWSGSTCTVTTKTARAVFRYTAYPVDVSGYASGSGANPAMPNPTINTWAGCVEERGDPTIVTTSFNAGSPPPDLDVDSAPNSDENTKWRPLWPEVEFARVAAVTEDWSGYRTPISRFHYAYLNGTSFGQSSGTYEYAHVLNEVPCPKVAQRLQTFTAAQITSYLTASSGFRPYGVTYHDYGMTWGTRLLSPTGIFASDTAAWAGHNPPNRYIVFLTDGAMEPDLYAYSAHGMENWDKRVAGNTPGNMTANHNTRFTTACQIAKNHNIKIFVIAYAQTITSQLQACASPNQAYYASDTAGLDAAFSSIAKQVAMLRISK